MFKKIMTFLFGEKKPKYETRTSYIENNKTLEQTNALSAYRQIKEFGSLGLGNAPQLGRDIRSMDFAGRIFHVLRDELSLVNNPARDPDFYVIKAALRKQLTSHFGFNYENTPFIEIVPPKGSWLQRYPKAKAIITVVGQMGERVRVVYTANRTLVHA